MRLKNMGRYHVVCTNIIEYRYCSFCSLLHLFHLVKLTSFLILVGYILYYSTCQLIEYVSASNYSAGTRKQLGAALLTNFENSLLHR